MEKPYNGRAVLTDNFGSFEIMIPAKKNWFVIIFLGAWLGGWTMGEIFALGAVTGIFGFNPGPANFFLLFWLIGWTAGGFFAMRTFFWMLLGKEIITFEQSTVTIALKGGLFSKPKTYDLNEAKNFTVYVKQDFSFGRKNNFNLADNGTLQFDYGLKTIKFGDGLDFAEANFILEKLIAMRFLTDKNLGKRNGAIVN